MGAAGVENSGVPTTGGAGTTGSWPGTGTGELVSSSGGATSTGTTGGDTCGFLCGTDEDATGVTPCDVFKQDCPEGEKCSAYADDGGTSWNASKCVPVNGDGQPGEPCTVEGSALRTVRAEIYAFR